MARKTKIEFTLCEDVCLSEKLRTLFLFLSRTLGSL